MEQMSEQKLHIIERGYENEEECNKDVDSMLQNGFKVESDYHDMYLYYRKFVKEI